MSSAGDLSTGSKAIFERNKLEYEEMRRRLLDTEEKLKSLRKLEEEDQSVTSEITDKISSVSNYRSGPQSWSHQEDLDSVMSALSTVPGSYTGFAHQNMAASTPSKTHSRRRGHANKDGFESDSSTDSTKENKSGIKYERKLLVQNQRLLVEVERLIGDLHSSKLENASLSKDADQVKKIPDLEERIEELMSESQAHDKALREAEKHLEDGAKRYKDLQKRLELSDGEVADLRSEVEEHREAKKVIESQRDEAIQNLIEMQESWEDYQRRTKDKFKKLEQREDELRDSVNCLTQERDDLLDQLGDSQANMASQEAQINRLLRDVELEEGKRRQCETNMEELQDQLDQLTGQLRDLDSIARKGEVLRQEKLELEKELSEHRFVAHDVAELLNLFQKKQSDPQNISGNCNVQAFDQDSQISVTDASLNTNNNGLEDHNFLNTNNNVATTQPPPRRASAAQASAPNSKVNLVTKSSNRNVACGGTSNIGELRSLFCNMDGEIQRLRVDLKQRDSDDRTYMNLREELKLLMEKAEKGISRNQELECMIMNLEDNKKTLESKLDDAIHALEERDRQNQCLDTRLSERNRQVVCLQEDTNNKAQKICSLEQMVRELNQKLNGVVITDCREELDAAQKRVKELEDYLAVKEASYAELQMKFLQEQKDAKAEKNKLEKKICCLSDQIHEFERQMEALTRENESQRQRVQQVMKDADDQRRIVRNKDETIKELESKLEELAATMEEEKALCSRMMTGLQEKLAKSEEHAKQLESALMMCKQEVAKHLDTMDNIKKHFDAENQKKDMCIKSLNEMLRKTKEDLDCKMNEVNSLEHSIMAMKSKIEQVFTSLKESENNNNCLTDKLKMVEKQALSDKTCCLKEIEGLDRKLAQSLQNLQLIQTECNTLKQALQEKSSQVDCLTIEKNSVCRELQGCQKKAGDLQEQMKKMEGDNTELCTQLQHKMECIKDLETALCNKDHDLKNCTRCLEELNNKFLSINSNKGDAQAEMKALVDKLKCCTDDLLKKNRLLVECEEALKRCQMEVQGRQDEISQLNVQLSDLNCKLQERIVKVEELEKQIECVHKDTEKRMKRVDEQLRRYECELTDKVRQLTDMDECLSSCQHKLAEKNNECCQLEQKNQRLCMDLATMECKLKDLEDQRERCSKHLSESKGENAEITQELRVTREQLQTQHCELVDTRQSLANCNRELEKVRRQIDELCTGIELKESELKKCCEEKNALLNKVAHLQCRMDADLAQAQQQMHDYKAHVEKELENCRGCTAEVEANNSTLVQKLAASQRQLQHVEKTCHQKLDGLNRELEDLLNRLADREDQICAMKDQLNCKESEMMRLKLRLCACDNSCNNNSNISEQMTTRGVEDRLSPPVDDLSRVNDSIAGKTGKPVSQSHLAHGEPEHTDRLSSIPQHQHKSRQSHSHADRLEDQDLSDGHTSSSARHSLGVSDVQERLRSNQLLQMEIEAQLKSLEDSTPEEINIQDQY